VATLLVFFAALAVALVYPPVFRASASILMKPPTGLEAARRAEKISHEDLASELEVLTSRELIGHTVSRLEAEGFELDKGPQGEGLTTRIQAFLYARLHGLPSRDNRHQQLTSWLQDRLEAQILPSTHVLRIRCSAGNPDDAERILTTHLTAYKPYRMEIGALNDETALISKLVDQRSQNIRELEQRRLKLAESSRSIQPEKELEAIVTLRFDLFDRYSRLRDESLATGLKTNAHLDERMDELLQQMASLDERSEELQQVIIDQQQIASELKVALSEHEKFKTWEDETGVRSAFAIADQQTGISIINPPQHSARIIFPKTKLLVAFGLIAGLVAGCAWGFLLAFLDQRIHRPEDVARSTGLPVLLEIPSGSVKGR
jgi:uncharacterized protein involved in exopolysaccharide biosynthesis